MTQGTATGKKQYGRLLFVRNGKATIIADGPWALLQHKKRQLKTDPQFAGGVFKLTYIR